MLKRLTGTKECSKKMLKDRVANIRYCHDLCVYACATIRSDEYALELVQKY